LNRACTGDIAERAVVWLDKVDDLIAVLSKKMPDLLKEFRL
jgi:hypothetical protein